MILKGVVFLATILIGIIATIFSFKTIKYSIDEMKKSLWFRAYAILIMSLGFIVHTAGDYFGSAYSDEIIELSLESFAHVIIFASLILCVISTKRIMEMAKKYKFK